MGTNFYQILGVRNGAHPAEIDLAYKTLSQVPDLDIETQLELSIAYQTLLHPTRRAEHDAALTASLPAVKQSTIDDAMRTLREQAHIVPQKPVVVWDSCSRTAEISPTNKVLTSFLTFYMLGFAAMSILGLVALVI